MLRWASTPASHRWNGAIENNDDALIATRRRPSCESTNAAWTRGVVVALAAK